MTALNPPSLAPGKSIASLFLLPDCNMACRFCASELDFSVMTWSQAEGLLRHLHGCGVRNVVLGGGEPFLWPHGLLDLCALAKSLGFLVQVCTNATRLPEGCEHAPGVDRFVLPLEAVDADLHDHLRMAEGGHHVQVLEAVERLAAAGRSLTFSTVVTCTNLKQLRPLAAFLADLRNRGARLHAWHLYRFLPVGRAGRAQAHHLGTTLDVFRGAVGALQQLDLGFPVYRRTDMLKASSVAYFWADAQGLCSSG